jgi:lauroyl/myristoyl acyltransferase
VVIDAIFKMRPKIQLVLLSVKLVAYQLLLLGISLLPRSASLRMVKMLARFNSRHNGISSRTRQLAIERTLCLNSHAAAGVVARSFELAILDDLDYWFYRRGRRRLLDRLITIKGLEKLDTALSRGHGAILCSGHLHGIFPFLVALSLRGYTLRTVRKRPSGTGTAIHRWFNEHRTLVRGKMATPFLWMQAENFGVAVQATNALRRNEVIVMLLDPKTATHGVVVDFLDQRVQFPNTPALIAQAAHAPMLSFFIERPEGGTWQVEINEPVEVLQDSVGSVRYFARQLENHIRRHPEVWLRWSALQFSPSSWNRSSSLGASWCRQALANYDNLILIRWQMSTLQRYKHGFLLD